MALPSVNKKQLLIHHTGRGSLCLPDRGEGWSGVFCAGLHLALPLYQDWLWLKSGVLGWTNLDEGVGRWWRLCYSLDSPPVPYTLTPKHGPILSSQHSHTWATPTYTALFPPISECLFFKANSFPFKRRLTVLPRYNRVLWKSPLLFQTGD